MNVEYSSYSDNTLISEPKFLCDIGMIGLGIMGRNLVLNTAITLGIPLPAFMASLSYFDAYRSAQSPANLIQAQRDYFGAHTY